MDKKLFYGNEKKIQAFELLKKEGIFVPVKDLKLYHGRARTAAENSFWKVNPKFDNGGNKTNNNNILTISAIYAADNKEQATMYAEKRVRQNKRDGIQAEPEVHRILSYDKNAVVFDIEKFDEYRHHRREDIDNSLCELIRFRQNYIPLSRKEDVDGYMKALEIMINHKIDNGFIKEEIVEKLYNENFNSGLLKKHFMGIASALSTRTMLMNYPGNVFSSYSNEKDYAKYMEQNHIPLNFEYFSSWCQDNHVVGFKWTTNPSIAVDEMKVYNLFDLDKINRDSVVGEELRRIIDEFAGIAYVFKDFTLQGINNEELLFSSPFGTVSKMTIDDEVKSWLDIPSGVWEGYTVEEHTEAVLRVFESSFEDKLPNEIIPFIKTVLCCHDIGKGMAYKDRGNQDKYNAFYANKFLTKFGVEEKARELIIGVITQSQKYTTDYYIHKNLKAYDDLKQYCGQLLKNYLDRKPNYSEVYGLMNICKVLQTCDSGAYTPNAIIRDTKTNIGYRGANQRFAEAFDFYGLTNNRFVLKEPTNEK